MSSTQLLDLKMLMNDEGCSLNRSKTSTFIVHSYDPEITSPKFLHWTIGDNICIMWILAPHSMAAPWEICGLMPWQNVCVINLSMWMILFTCMKICQDKFQRNSCQDCGQLQLFDLLKASLWTIRSVFLTRCMHYV